MCARVGMWVPACGTVQADIIIAAIGRPQFVRGDWLKPGVVVIDVGINTIPDPTRKSGFRLVGDVHYPEVRARATHITPYPIIPLSPSESAVCRGCIRHYSCAGRCGSHDQRNADGKHSQGCQAETCE